MQTTVEAPAIATPQAATQAAPGAPPVPGSGGDFTTPAAVYQGHYARASVLKGQLEELIDQRGEEITSLRQMSGGDMAGARTVVHDRIARLDKRIAGLEEQIVQADAQVATSAAVPGAFEAPRPSQDPDEAGLFFGGMSLAIALMIVYRLVRRKFWKRKGKVAKAENLQLPGELSVRLERLENVAEATALEVERIGEGQRFVTKLLSESARPVEQPVERK